MKRVLVLRHGNAYNSNNILDHDRKLLPSGISDAKLIGKHLLEINSIPDLIITSSAVRALSTAKNTIDGGLWKTRLVVESGIYGGNPEYLLYLLSEQNDKYKTICLVGHEPNFSLFIAKSTDNIHRSLQTANIALIDYNIDKWSDIKFGQGILSWLITPDSLK